MGALASKLEACPKHQLSLLGLGELASLAGVLLGEQGSGLRRLDLLGSGLRRLRPSFRVMQLSHKSKLQGKQANLENKSEARNQVNLEKLMPRFRNSWKPVAPGRPQPPHHWAAGTTTRTLNKVENVLNNQYMIERINRLDLKEIRMCSEHTCRTCFIN